MLRKHRLTARLSLGLLGLLLAGCSGQSPVVMLDTQGGPIVLHSPSPSGPDGMPPPPPGLEPTTPVPPPGYGAAPVPRDGSYSGTGEVLMTGGGLCRENITLSNFKAYGSSARFGGFRGTIQPDSSVQMFYGRDWIVGQFEPGGFRGQLDLPEPMGGPGCSYMLNLRRVGP